MYKNIKKFVSFIGGVRTGHTLVGSLLDAHPNIDISIRQNPMLKLENNISRNSLFDIIIKYCKKSKRKIGGYSYLINNSKRGNIYVIGDSAATYKNMKKISNNKIFNKFCNYIRVPIYWIWVIRDPFETVQSACKISGKPIDNVIERYEEAYLLSHKFCKKHKGKVIIVYLEELIKDPKKEVSKILDFIVVPYDKKYLDNCARFVFSNPHKVFNSKIWNKKQLNKVNNIIKNISELSCYGVK